MAKYLKNILRLLWVYRRMNIINIIGLTLSFTVAMAIFLLVNHEFSSDDQHENRHRIYRLETDNGATLPWLISKQLKQEVPEIEEVTVTTTSNSCVFHRDEKRKSFRTLITDTNYLKLFTCDFIDRLDASNPIKDDNIIISEDAAEYYFGDENPVGKTLRVKVNGGKDQKDYLISALMKNFKSNTSIKADIIMNDKALKVLKKDTVYNKITNNISINYLTYILLKPNIDFDKVSHKILSVIDKECEENYSFIKRSKFRLMPLDDMYFEGASDWNPKGDKKMTLLFAAIAILVILVASFNYINIKTAITIQRAKEIMICKVLGAGRKSLVFSVLIETLILGVISFFLSIVLLEISMPFIRNLLPDRIELHIYEDVHIFLYFFISVFLLSALTSIYPAIILSSYKPVNVMKGSLRKSSEGLLFRRILVIMQFVISVFLIVCTLVIYSQVRHMKNKDLGFEKSSIVMFRVNSSMINNSSGLKYELLSSPDIEAVSYCSGYPGSIEDFIFTDIEGEDMKIPIINTDDKFIETLKIKLLEGRNFDPNPNWSNKGEYVVNQAALKLFKDGKALNKKIGREDIIGVMKDFNFMPVSESIKPLALYCGKNKKRIDWMAVRISDDNFNSGIDFLEKKYIDFSKNSDFNYYHLEERFNRNYREEDIMMQLFLFFSALSILIACLGVFGLSVFLIQQKRKNIGIRKILGASTLRVFLLESKEFIYLVLIANIISWPFAWLFLDNWLSDFDYRISFSIMFFIIGLILSFIISLGVMSYHFVEISKARPIDSIKSE
ncbi:MAG: ABC transporter permease [Hyphomicrobiales bacterium]